MKKDSFAKALRPRNGAVLESWPSGTWQAPKLQIVERILQLRMWRSVPLQVAARRAGVSRAAWSKWELGRTLLGSRVLLLVCKGLGVGLADIVQSPGHQDLVRGRAQGNCCCKACEQQFDALQAALIEIDGDIWEDVYQDSQSLDRG